MQKSKNFFTVKIFVPGDAAWTKLLYLQSETNSLAPRLDALSPGPFYPNCAMHKMGKRGGILPKTSNA